MTMETKRRFVLNVVVVVFALAIFYISVRYILPLIMPFVIAFCISAFLQKPIDWLSKLTKGRRKGWAILVTSLFFIIIGGGLSYVLYLLGGSIAEIAADSPVFIQNVAAEIANATEGTLNDFIALLPDKIEASLMQYAQSISKNLSETLFELAQKYSAQLISLAGFLGSYAKSIPGIIVAVVMTVVGTFFICPDYRGIKQFVLKLFPENKRNKARRIKHCIVDTVYKLLKTYATLMLITFVELMIGFLIINFCGYSIGYIPIIAALISLIDILPVLGVGTVLIPWAVIGVLMGEWVLAIMILILYVVIWIVRYYLEPKFVGERFDVHPIITLLAIYVGGKLLGVLGVFLLPLTIIVIKRLNDVGLFKLFKTE